MVDQGFSELLTGWRQDLVSDFGLDLLDPGALTVGRLRDAILQGPFLDPHRVIAVRSLPARKADAMALALRDIPDTSWVLLSVVGPLKASGALRQAVVAAGGVVKDCPPLKKRELEEWIRERARLHGLPPQVAATVGRTTNPNLGVMESELLKLAAYQASGAKLDQAALADLLVGDRQDDIFRLTDNLLPSATPAAWRALESLLQTESPTGIAYRIARHVSLVLEVGTHRSQGLGLAAVQGQMREHPYVIQKAYELGARVSLERLEGSLGALLDYEWRVKSGQIDAEWGLRSLLAQL